ncbi:MAG: hypothetical protein ACJA1W_000946 [Akkermansiaceae bacterium]|jgi:hypothetical protein
MFSSISYDNDRSRNHDQMIVIANEAYKSR